MQVGKVSQRAKIVKSSPKFGNYFLLIVTPIVMGVTAGMQWLMAGLLISGLHPRPRILSELTDNGIYWYRPDYDLPVYIIGCGVILGLVLFWAWLLRRKFLHVPVQQSVIYKLTGYGLLSAFVQILLILVFKNMVLDFWHLPVAYSVKVLLTGAWLLLLLAPSTIAIVFSLRLLGHLIKFITFWVEQLRRKRGLIIFIVDLLMLELLFALIYIPDWQYLSGKVFINDIFLHWDGFAIRTILALRHGLVLGRDVFIQYGVGWLWVFAKLSSHGPLLYGKVIQQGVLFACFYYIGAYILFRLLTKNVLWSIGGIFLLLYFQLFLKNYPQPFLWETPSSTILRSYFDVWFFITLYLSEKTKKMWWRIATAMIAGVAFLFEFDTGIYLIATVSIISLYLLARSFLGRSGVALKTEIKKCVSVLIIPLLTIVGGLIVMSGSVVLKPEFWTGLLEGIAEYGGGISNLPIVSVKPTIRLVQFEIIAGFYLVVIAQGLLKFFSHEETSDDTIAAALSLYGLAILLYFIGRSHQANLYYTITPVCLLLVWVLAKGGVWFVKNWHLVFGGKCNQLKKPLYYLAPILLIVISGGVLVKDNVYAQYPNVINNYLHGHPKGICLKENPQDICGLSETDRPKIVAYTSVVEWMMRKAAEKKSVAVFDNEDPLYYLLSDGYPYFRYRPGEVFTKKQLARIFEQIQTQPPDYILLRVATITKDDVFKQTRELISRSYEQKEVIGGYEIWSRK